MDEKTHLRKLFCALWGQNRARSLQCAVRAGLAAVRRAHLLRGGRGARHRQRDLPDRCVRAWPTLAHLDTGARASPVSLTHSIIYRAQ